MYVRLAGHLLVKELQRFELLRLLMRCCAALGAKSALTQLSKQGIKRQGAVQTADLLVDTFGSQ